MAKTTCVLVDTGIDYLTVTTKPGGSTMELLELAYEFGSEAFNDGMWRGSAWGIRGYRGEQIGSIGYGDSEQGGIVQCSGGVSTALAAKLVESGIACHCSRIDFQCTGQWNRDCKAYGRRVAHDLHKAQVSSSGGRPAKTKSIVGWGDGDSVYSGSRSSDRYLRVYDKSREQHFTTGKNLWRWEVEFKNKLAARAWGLVSSVTIDACLTEGVVVSEVERRGVVVPWEQQSGIGVISQPGTKSDVSRKLTWIKNQVMPTFVFLYQSGFGDTLESMIDEAREKAKPSAGKCTNLVQESEEL